MMENTVYNFLVDIVNEVHPAIQTGINRYTIEIHHNAAQDMGFIYYGNKHNLYCQQVGREIHIAYTLGPLRKSPNFWQVDLARPDSRETIANIFRTN